MTHRMSRMNAAMKEEFDPEKVERVHAFKVKRGQRDFYVYATHYDRLLEMYRELKKKVIS